MKLRLETSHEVRFRAVPKNGDGYEASVFVKPYIDVDCSALWERIKEKFNIQESQDSEAEPER